MISCAAFHTPRRKVRIIEDGKKLTEYNSIVWHSIALQNVTKKTIFITSYQLESRPHGNILQSHGRHETYPKITTKRKLQKYI